MFSPKTWGEVASWVCGTQGTQIYIARLSFNTKCSSSLLKCRNSGLTKFHSKTLLNLLKTHCILQDSGRLNTSQMRHSPGQLQSRNWSFEKNGLFKQSSNLSSTRKKKLHVILSSKSPQVSSLPFLLGPWGKPHQPCQEELQANTGRPTAYAWQSLAVV